MDFNNVMLLRVHVYSLKAMAPLVYWSFDGFNRLMVQHVAHFMWLHLLLHETMGPQPCYAYGV